MRCVLFMYWKSKSLHSLNDIPHRWFSLYFTWLFWTLILSCVSTWIPTLGQFTTILLVTVKNSDFAGFNDILLQVNHSNISRNRLLTWSESMCKDIHAYTSTVSSAYILLPSLEHTWAKSLEFITKNKGSVLTLELLQIFYVSMIISLHHIKNSDLFS